MWKFAVLMASYSRVEKTLRCIETLTMGLSDAAAFSVDIFLTDDGSTDGTGEQVKSRFPQVHLIRGDGSLFWAGGMRAAWHAADMNDTYDFVVWANDDVEFSPSAVRSSFEEAVQLQKNGGSSATILVGTILDPNSGGVTYGGVNRPNPISRPLYFELVSPSTGAVDCETFNGNFVIIPSAVVKVIGGMNSAYVHAYGDYDYGFRARQAGFRIMVLTTPVGTCSRNSWVSTDKITSMTLSQRWRRMTGPKLYPLSGWFAYSRAHTGPFWPVFFLRPYWEVLFPWLFSRLR